MVSGNPCREMAGGRYRNGEDLVYILGVPGGILPAEPSDPSALLRDALHEPGHEVLSDFNSGASDIPPALLFYVLPDGIGDEPEHETFEGK